MSTEEQTQAQNAPFLALKAAALAASRASSVDDYLQEATERMSEAVGSEYCSLLVVRDGQLWGMGAVGLPPEYVAAIDGIPVGPFVGTCGKAAALGQPCVTPDVLEDPNWTEFVDLAESAGLRSCWSVPLLGSDGRTLATFASYSSRPFAPTAEQLAIADAHASLVALGLEKIRNEERDERELRVRGRGAQLGARRARRVHGRAFLRGRPPCHCRRAAPRDTNRDLQTVEQVAVLHDIGKLGMPTEILKSPRPLTFEEWGVIRQHPVIGERILSGYRTSATSRRPCGTSTSAGTGRATRMASAATRSRPRAASSSPATPGTP